MTVPLLHILQQQEVGTCACKVHGYRKQIVSGGGGGGLIFSKHARKSLTSCPLPHPSKACIQCTSARSISAMYNQPYRQKLKFGKHKPSIFHPKIASLQDCKYSIDQCLAN